MTYLQKLYRFPDDAIQGDSTKWLKNEPCDFIKGRDKRRSGKGNPLKRDGSIDVARLIFSASLPILLYMIFQYACELVLIKRK